MAKEAPYRVAILIMAHNEPNLLRLLVNRMIQDFDVYIHLDKKAEAELASVLPQSSRIRRIPSTRTPWGTTSFLKAELTLIREALAGRYDRYVLVSGQCVSLRSNREIRELLERHQSKEWIGSRMLQSPEDDGFLQRVTRVYWHAPWRYSGLKKAMYSIVEYGLEFYYRFVSRPRKLRGDYYFGETWFALSHEALTKALVYADGDEVFRHSFRGARLSEELYLQTAIRRTGIRDADLLPCVSYTDWETGPETPRVLTVEDREVALASEHLFARKFTWAKSKELAERLYDETK